VKLLNLLLNLDKIVYGDDDIEDDLDSIMLNPVASTISKLWTFKLLRRVHLWTDWWIWMTLFIMATALKVISII
jgi:hypothetical protein